MKGTYFHIARAENIIFKPIYRPLYGSHVHYKHGCSAFPSCPRLFLSNCRSEQTDMPPKSDYNNIVMSPVNTLVQLSDGHRLYVIVVINCGDNVMSGLALSVLEKYISGYLRQNWSKLSSK
jgi:hypothetical protein